MTASRIRLALALLALALGVGAALVRTPAPLHPRAAIPHPVYKPASGC